jgi:putative effector of murein hydrolase
MRNIITLITIIMMIEISDKTKDIFLVTVVVGSMCVVGYLILWRGLGC